MLTRPATARKRAGTAPGAMREEMLIEMQFADIAEVLRRMCFAYGNRYIEADRPDSDAEADGPPGSLADDEEAARIFQLPNTDAEPYVPRPERSPLPRADPMPNPLPSPLAKRRSAPVQSLSNAL